MTKRFWALFPKLLFWITCHSHIGSMHPGKERGGVAVAEVHHGVVESRQLVLALAVDIFSREVTAYNPDSRFHWSILY